MDVVVIDTSAVVAILFDESNPAGLNIGDCFPYALASATNHALLFKGNDFSQTDIRPALT